MNLTVNEACDRLGVSRATIRRMRDDGRLRAIRSEAFPKGRVLIDAESLKRLAAQRAAEIGAAHQPDEESD